MLSLRPRVSLSVACVALALLQLHVAQACASAADCSLNGDCVNSVCVCDPWWSGSAACDVLAFEPTPLHTGYDADGANTSWGGLPVYENATGLWHLFAAEMDNSCGLWTWKTNSRVSRATSPDPNGPFEYAETVVVPFAHNPKAFRAPDGTYLIYFIGGWVTQPQTCGTGAETGIFDGVTLDTASGYPGPTNDTCGPAPLNGGCGLALASSNSLYGPWNVTNIVITNQNASALLDCAHTNPAPFFFDNGSVAMLVNAGYCHSNLETIGIVQAPSWRGPYSLRVTTPIFINSDGSPHSCEDPTLWVDARGWHAMVHNFGRTISLYAHSLDGYQWTLHDDAGNPGPYTGAVQWANGSVRMYDVERPQLLFLDQPSTGGIAKPAYLVNGAIIDSGSGRSFTLFRPLRQS